MGISWAHLAPSGWEIGFHFLSSPITIPFHLHFSNWKSFQFKSLSYFLFLWSQVASLKAALALIVPGLIATRELADPAQDHHHHIGDPALRAMPGQRGKCPNGAAMCKRESFDVLPPRTASPSGMTLMQPDARIDYVGLSGRLASHTFLFKFHLFLTRSDNFLQVRNTIFWTRT